jgi:hypothetical protein
MAVGSILTPSPGWGFFYRLPSLPSSRAADHHHVDTSGHTLGVPARRLSRPSLRLPSSREISTDQSASNHESPDQGVRPPRNPDGGFSGLTEA